MSHLKIHELGAVEVVTMSKLFLLLPCRAVQSRRRWGELAWLRLRDCRLA